MSLKATCWAFNLRDIAPRDKLALIILSDSCGCGDAPDEIEISPDRLLYWAKVYGCSVAEFEALLGRLELAGLLRRDLVEGRDGGRVSGLRLDLERGQ